MCMIRRLKVELEFPPALPRWAWLHPQFVSDDVNNVTPHGMYSSTVYYYSGLSLGEDLL